MMKKRVEWQERMAAGRPCSADGIPVRKLGGPVRWFVSDVVFAPSAPPVEFELPAADAAHRFSPETLRPVASTSRNRSQRRPRCTV